MEYYSYTNIFSKREFNLLLPLYKGVNYKIKLNKPPFTHQCPFYKKSLKELIATKK